MYYLHSSDRSEHLLQALQLVLQQPLKQVLAAELIIVQNPGMARWLTHRLAQKQGIAANLEFPLAGRFVWQLFTRLLPDIPAKSPFDREVMLWKCLAQIPELLEQTAFADLKHYLQQRAATAEQRELALYQLSAQIAELFDQYLVYRPEELILKWQEGQGVDWQAQLWRKLCDSDPKQAQFHRAALLKQLQLRLKNYQGLQQQLPERLCLFGLSAMTPVYLQLFQALAQHIEVHFFVLNPSLEYWGDNLSEKQFYRLQRRQRQMGQIELSLEQPDGNPLLNSMGKQSREFLQQLQQVAAGEEYSYYQSDPASNQLALLQQAIRHNQTHWQAIPNSSLKLDHSLQFHSVHNRLREIQVLHDQLLKVFADSRHNHWQLHDIVIMAPDISQYVGAIRAVFDSAHGARQLEYRIADLDHQQGNAIEQLLMQWLQLPQLRCTRTEVLSWLGIKALQRRLKLTEEAVQHIQIWVEQSQIFWGLNAQHRAELGLEAESQNTWAFGVERLILGWCLDDDSNYFADKRACHALQGLKSDWLGRLDYFLQRLDYWRQIIAKKHRWEDWLTLLQRCFLELLEPDESEQAYWQRFTEVLQQGLENSRLGQFEQPVSAAIVREHLQNNLKNSGFGSHFLSGRLTFCNMMPMRSIPFRMVALLGLNDREFPRQPRNSDFDWMTKHPKAGDRNPREEDRTLFLEALLAAREQFYCSFIGRDQRSNDAKPASTVLQELLQHLQHNGVNGDGLIQQHPLQAFDSSYFKADSPQSFACDWMPPKQSSENTLLPLSQHPVTQTTAIPTSLDLADFLRAPCRYFLRQHYQLNLAERIQEPQDEENLELNGLHQYLLKTQWLINEDQFSDRQILAEGILAPGQIGRWQLQQQRQQWGVTRQALQAKLDTQTLYHRDLSATVQKLQLLQFDICSNAQFSAIGLPYSSGFKAWRLIQIWIQHLISAYQGEKRPSLYLYFNKQALEAFEFAAQTPETARAQLEYLIALWRQSWHQPLAFLPQTAWQLIEKHKPQLHATESLNDAVQEPSEPLVWSRSALDCLFGSAHQIAELDSETQLLYPSKTICNEQFLTTSWQLYSRLFSNLSTV